MTPFFISEPYKSPAPGKAGLLLRIARYTLLSLAFIWIAFSLGGCRRTKTFYHEGVSKELARYRARQVYDVHYDLKFRIPESLNEAVTGVATIRFKPLKARHGVILDFVPGEEHVHGITVNGKEAEYHIMSGHIYIDANPFIPRQENVVEISFTSSAQALNRSNNFMYTLFVPDRASTAFPCFDQPDIKASFSLTLDIPQHWQAIANGMETSQQVSESRKTVHFAPDHSISTYLFAFAAGEFDILTHEEDGRTLRMFHRETDQEKLKRNAPEIFSQHLHSLQWLEEYTGIPYPYEKFDMALLPGFQYSGMEHPGAVWYRDTRLLLDEDASLPEIKRKASLIAHETAHMWFGNLVTMEWFDDVWLKEVFAGFMADKIIQEQFPEENHQLQFVLSHYPRAMGVDRSRGTHPIKQELDNMKMAGTLYGAIIYNKAPIVFEQLEMIMQPQPFRTAVQEYLNTYAHGNADWDDLVTILDKHTPENIEAWSNTWIYGKGLPELVVREQGTESLAIILADDARQSGFPAQYLGATFITADKTELHKIWFDHSPLTPAPPLDKTTQSLILLNGQGAGYGFFRLRDRDISIIMNQLTAMDDENIRAAIYINMFENFLNAALEEGTFFRFLIEAIEKENHPLLQNYLLSCLRTWALSFPGFSEDLLKAVQTEELLWNRMHNSSAGSARMFFESWMALARSQDATDRMSDLYNGINMPPSLQISENNRTQLALEAAMRGNHKLLEMEKKRMENPDRLRRLEFIIPAVSPDKAMRDQFFNRLKEPQNRRPEPWVLEALYFLHHPLHPQQGKDYIEESLKMLEELQRTGDIFFPLNWLHATLDNYQQAEAAELVSEYLAGNPELQENLKLKVLQAADMLFRSGEGHSPAL